MAFPPGVENLRRMDLSPRRGHGTATAVRVSARTCEARGGTVLGTTKGWFACPVARAALLQRKGFEPDAEIRRLQWRVRPMNVWQSSPRPGDAQFIHVSQSVTAARTGTATV
jgi:hypothetical protein